MSEAVPVREGDVLAGKYRVERVIGSGGMGVVVSAVHTQIDQRVAIKFVREDAIGNADAVERFVREARASVKLKSEHAARVIDVGTLESGAPYMVMEYLEGSDLGAVLAAQGVLSIQSAAEWIVQACEAIAEAHAMGIVHRDIKPQNLFLAKSVGGQAKVKVLDFGVSKSMATSGPGALTQTHAMLGSPLYMSPEQMRSSRDVDARSDVWALGVVLYELLTKRWPFEAESMPELCLKVVSDLPVPVASHRADVPNAMVEVIERCLQKDPGRRYANAGELAAALEPLAPPASRAVVERAQLAVGSTRSSAITAQPQVSAAQPTPDVYARTAVTPSTWDSDRGKTREERSKKPAPVLWLGVGGAGLAAGAIVAFVFHGHATVAPAASASAEPALSVVVAPPVSLALTAAVLGPPVPSPSTAPAVSAAASVSVASPISHPAALPSNAGGRTGPTAHPPAAPSARPKPPDDDIPSLR